MKKIWITLILALSLCVSELPTVAFAVEHEPDVSDTEQTVFVDLSDKVLQEGGYLSETGEGKEQIALFSLSAEDQTKQIQDTLIAAWDSFEDSCDLSSYQITAAELKAIYSETLNENSGYFYVSGGYSYSFLPTGYVTKVIIQYRYNKAEAEPMIAAYNMAVAAAVSGADASWTDMEKALYINDYIARNCEYDTSYSKHSAYDALVGKKAVCEGYTLAFKALAQELGLSCGIVTSSSLNHAWNLVAVNGSYYHVDVTWNDPLNDRIGRARHQYFMKSTNYFKSEEGEHLEENDWAVSGGMPAEYAIDTTYDAYFWNTVDTGFDYIDGYWYGFDGKDSINRYICNGTDFSYAEDLVAIEDVWNVLNNPSSFWQGKYVGIGLFNGNLYYSGKDSIYMLDAKTGAKTSIFTLSEEQKKSGYIYGMNVTPTGEVNYILAESPNELGTVYEAALLRCAEHKNQEVRNQSEATCGKDGYTGDTYCSDCGILISLGQSIPKLPHAVAPDSAVEATCTTEGKTQGSHCEVCGTVLVAQEIIPAAGHNWDTNYTVDKEATATEPGVESIHCRNCGATKDVREIPIQNSYPGATPQQIANAVITLSQTSYSYDGSAKKPSVKSVKLGNVTLKSDDYTVSYQNNKNIGTATVTVTGRGNYAGTVTKTFTISAKKGSIFSVGAYKYKITNSKEAAFAGLKSSKTTKVTILKTVKIGGKSFKVTSIAARALRNTKVTSVTIGANVKTIGSEAFRSCKKLGRITVKSTILKTVGKNALKGIKSTAKIKVPSKKLAAYKKLLGNKGQGKKVKITK